MRNGGDDPTVLRDGVTHQRLRIRSGHEVQIHGKAEGPRAYDSSDPFGITGSDVVLKRATDGSAFPREAQLIQVGIDL